MNFLSVILFSLSLSVCLAKQLPKHEDKCHNLLGDELIAEILSYEKVKDEILNYVLQGDFKGQTYDQ